MIQTISNDSTHSATFAVDAPLKQAAHVEVQQKRSVAFDEDNNQYYDNTSRCAEDCAATWFTSADYREFRQTYREQTNQAAASSNFKAIRDLYLTCTTVNFILEDASELGHAAAKVQAAAQSMTSFDLIGMESNLCAAVKKDMRKKRESIQDVVFDIQLECDRGLWENVEEMQTELYESCINYTQACGLFAQLIAQMQAQME
mmetsp:Transcript_13923/g.30429  ORF Transcript_13923/g.30429 Transcript_13923/m.30429 type:complete len:202 (-) Transcript_13923:183-788(-)